MRCAERTSHDTHMLTCILPNILASNQLVCGVASQAHLVHEGIGEDKEGGQLDQALAHHEGHEPCGVLHHLCSISMGAAFI